MITRREWRGKAIVVTGVIVVTGFSLFISLPSSYTIFKCSLPTRRKVLSVYLMLISMNCKVFFSSSAIIHANQGGKGPGVGYVLVYVALSQNW